MTTTDQARTRADAHSDIVYPSAIPFVLVHLACFAAIWTGVTWQSAVLCVALYWIRIFVIGAGYHRYFSHRAYATSRVFQFILAVVAQSTLQKSVLWWAAKHRHHHLHSDTEDDVHSPRHTGFLYSHMGWIFARRHDTFEMVKIADFARYPELMWLHKHERWPAYALAVLCFLIAGWPGLVVGFFWSTCLVFHGTFCINSLAHVKGSKRYVTGDDSRNNWLLAVFTMGEGWHNNHHACQSSVRQGFRWWEYDPTFYSAEAAVVGRRGVGPENAAGRGAAQRAAARLAGDRTRRPPIGGELQHGAHRRRRGLGAGRRHALGAAAAALRRAASGGGGTGQRPSAASAVARGHCRAGPRHVRPHPQRR